MKMKKKIAASAGRAMIKKNSDMQIAKNIGGTQPSTVGITKSKEVTKKKAACSPDEMLMNTIKKNYGSK